MKEKQNGVPHSLRQTKALKQAILDSLPAHIAVIDKDGIIVAVNGPWRRFAEENGLPGADSVCVGADYLAVCQRATDMADPLAREASEGIRSVLNGSMKDFSLEYPCDSPDEQRWFLMTVVNPQYKGLGAIISHNNTTQRRYWEEALLLSEKKFTTIFKNVPALLTITVLANGKIIEVNEVFLQTTGYTLNEVIGRTTLELGIWAEPHDREIIFDILKEEGSVHDMEVRFKMKNGNTLTGLFSAELIELKKEKHVLSMLKDITERKRMEEQITKWSEERAAYAVKLEILNNRLTSFNYTVSHDLRRPLNNMILHVQMIEQLYGDQLNEDCKNNIHKIFEGILQMNDLISTLLEFSNTSSLGVMREDVDLGLIARDVAAELIRTEPDRKVHFQMPTAIIVDCDPKLIRIVLVNLFSNAWKFTRKQDEAVIEFGTIDMEGKAIYFVRDNGCGFEKSEADKLFAPFHRLVGPEQHEGHGIGLATVERIIARHGGKVWAEGTPGQGATFYFTLH